MPLDRIDDLTKADDIAATRGSDAITSQWSEFLQRGADPDNPIQEHVFYLPKRHADTDVDGDILEKCTIRVQAGKAEEEFYETGQVGQ